jgi:hypothetical protein
LIKLESAAAALEECQDRILIEMSSKQESQRAFVKEGKNFLAAKPFACAVNVVIQ